MEPMKRHGRLTRNLGLEPRAREKCNLMGICSKLRQKLNIRQRKGEKSNEVTGEVQDAQTAEALRLENTRRSLEQAHDEVPPGLHRGDCDIEELIAHLKRGLKRFPLFWSARERTRQAELLSSLGHAHYKLCQFNAARKYYEKYLKCVTKVGSPAHLQRAHCNLGCVYRRLGDFDKAIQFLEKGLEMARELNDLRSQGRLLNNLGNIYESKGDFRTALEYHLQRKRVAGKLRDGDSQAKADASMANAYHCLGDIRRSIAFYERVILWMRRKSGKKSKISKQCFKWGSCSTSAFFVS